jgi:hypothetical protein
MKNRKQSLKVAFITRVLSFWIDGFVIFAITRIILSSLSIISIYSPFGIVFLVVGALYDTGMLIRFKQTVGQQLTGIICVTRINKSPSLKQLFLRIWIGKWGMTFALPLVIAPYLTDLVWFPTIFDTLVFLMIILILAFHYLIFKKFWHEQISGLQMIVHPNKTVKKTGFINMILALGLLLITSGLEMLFMDRLPARLGLFQCSRSVKPFNNYLNTQHTAATEYILELFDNNDLVVLCERGHPEMKQYDFIHELISHPEFSTKVGNVFSELGQKGKQKTLDKFMSSENLSDEEIKDESMDLIRNFGVWPEWTNYNMFLYFQRLYKFNQSLPSGQRIQHHFTDAPLHWDSIKKPEDYTAFYKNFVLNRDGYMAQSVIDKVKTLKKAGKKHKGLVIMNYRHAMDLTGRNPSIKRKNTFEILKDSFGDKAVNVLINNRIISSIPVAQGSWDRALDGLNKPIGFDFKNTPFGQTRFDMFPFPMLFSIFEGNDTPIASGDLNYQDVFHGFVFTHSSDEQYFQSFVPNYFDAFEDEFLRRSALISPEYKEESIQLLAKYDTEKYQRIPKRSFEYQIETKIALYFSIIFWIGFLLGCFVFIKGKPLKKH